MKEEAQIRAKEWVANKFYDQESREEISELIKSQKNDEIIDRFYKDLEFGTGGIRGVIGAGSNRMNKYAIMRATQAVALELKKGSDQQLKVAISYDSRHFSFEFAKLAASVLAGNGIEAYIYSRLNPVALLSWSVRYHQAQAGIMITASHNPPEYNGYKVYWDDGCQVTAPFDQNIIDFYNKLTDLSTIPMKEFEQGIEEGMIHWVGTNVENHYLEMVFSNAINPEMCHKFGSQLKFIYTAIHGSGLIPCTHALNDLGFTNYEIVEEQSAPNGDFPTVESPNPENASALKMAVDMMVNTSSSIAMGTDPDCDRIGVAVRHQDEVYYLSGNQLGSLMLNYICQNLAEQGRLPENAYTLKTIVTTELQSAIAKHYGVTVENTLTGFKWLCGKMRDIENNSPERNFLFATEESFGYLNHQNVRDKDGVAPIALLAEMTLWYQRREMTLIDALNELYQKFGYYDETLLCLNYYGAEGADKIVRIMEAFRNSKERAICGETINSIEDYNAGTIRYIEGRGPTTIDLPKSNVLGYQFKSGHKLLLRPSGTEPKIKFYLLLKFPVAELEASKNTAKSKSDEIIKFIKDFSDKC